MVRCHEVGGNALTICMLSGSRISSILVKGSANLLSFHKTLEKILESPLDSLWTREVPAAFLLTSLLLIFSFNPTATLETPLDCKEIQPVNPKGNQP